MKVRWQWDRVAVLAIIPVSQFKTNITSVSTALVGLSETYWKWATPLRNEIDWDDHCFSRVKISIGISCSSRWVEWGGLPLEWDRMRRLRWPETGWRPSSIPRRSHHLVRSQSPYYQPAHSRRWKFLSKDCKQKLYNGNFLWEGSQKNLSCRLILWHCNQQWIRQIYFLNARVLNLSFSCALAF